MAQIECIGPFKVGMKSRRDQIALAAEALSKMFDKGEDELVSQVRRDQIECIGPLKVGMKSSRDQIALAAEALSKMFDKGEDELVS